ncbi:hypothetical protein VOLCADRAFT_106627 [Volvox carteri f. nagariensis]|uniref:Uncharacterized protein n=1 Tax=Volvox carteri f. nagariensis TaxID=3068 RepID=D8U8P9_VOLCA|nr:uncharacterized protein VOLCADRAFT_106627 [Volvox carteri f. nagariensis]EFJ43844.1 hypothetical protein VOLCADRAFT_106627 [Volvox carteri f. nagariensis]|eukprot:XP_002955090.1 hypothetical protein VOLCADRAFT_106627 [Volvox carteri f. nagariensis]
MSGRGGGRGGFGRGGGRGGFGGRGAPTGPVARDEDGTVLPTAPAGPPPLFPVPKVHQETGVLNEGFDPYKVAAAQAKEATSTSTTATAGASSGTKRARPPLSSVMTLIPEYFPEDLYSSKDMRPSPLEVDVYIITSDSPGAISDLLGRPPAFPPSGRQLIYLVSVHVLPPALTPSRPPPDEKLIGVLYAATDIAEHDAYFRTQSRPDDPSGLRRLEQLAKLESQVGEEGAPGARKAAGGAEGEEEEAAAEEELRDTDEEEDMEDDDYYQGMVTDLMTAAMKGQCTEHEHVPAPANSGRSLSKQEEDKEEDKEEKKTYVVLLLSNWAHVCVFVMSVVYFRSKHMSGVGVEVVTLPVERDKAASRPSLPLTVRVIAKTDFTGESAFPSKCTTSVDPTGACQDGMFGRTAHLYSFSTHARSCVLLFLCGGVSGGGFRLVHEVVQPLHIAAQTQEATPPGGGCLEPLAAVAETPFGVGGGGDGGGGGAVAACAAGFGAAPGRGGVLSAGRARGPVWEWKACKVGCERSRTFALRARASMHDQVPHSPPGHGTDGASSALKYTDGWAEGAAPPILAARYPGCPPCPLLWLQSDRTSLLLQLLYSEAAVKDGDLFYSVNYIDMADIGKGTPAS